MLTRIQSARHSGLNWKKRAKGIAYISQLICEHQRKKHVYGLVGKVYELLDLYLDTKYVKT